MRTIRVLFLVKHLSIAMVCKNNERTLPRVIEAVIAFRVGLDIEIVAVDSGSTDATIGLLEAAGAKVVRSAWLGHVKTKQFALEQCGSPWVLCLDSDEPPTAELRESIIKAVHADDPAVVGYRVNRKIWYRGRFLEYAWQPEWRLRLVRRGRCHWTGLDPHDRMEPVDGGVVMDLAGALRHDSFETFGEHLAKQVAHSKTAAASALAAGQRASRVRLITSPIGAFVKQLVLKQAWRDGTAGWLAAGTAAAGAIMKHMMMLEGEKER